MYKVVKYFTDLQDNSRPYNVGDVYPRKGLTVSDERIAELASSSNKQNTPLIAEVKPKAKPTEDPIEDTVEVEIEDTAEKPVEEPKKTTRRKRK